MLDIKTVKVGLHLTFLDWQDSSIEMGHAPSGCACCKIGKPGAAPPEQGS